MVCCVIGGGVSAVPRQWVGAIIVDCAEDQRPPGVSRAAALLRPQVPLLIVSTDGDPAGLSVDGAPVVVGEWAGSAGMLLAALEWTATHAWETPWVATAPARDVSIPPDLVVRLSAAVSGCAAEAACVADGGHLVLELGLWPVALRRPLRRFLAGGGETSLAAWARGRTVALVS